MSQPLAVTPSGTVGKQVFATNKPVELEGFLLSPGSASGVSVVIRDGNASGAIQYDLNTLKGVPIYVPTDQRFDKGMHVKVIGTGGQCFLQLC